MQILGLILGATVCLQYLQLLNEYIASLQMNDLSLGYQPVEKTKSFTNRNVTAKGWQGKRRFVVTSKIKETASVVTYQLAPEDRKPLPRFSPGQYLMLALKIPGQKRTVKRCYSLSSSPNRDFYCITVKKVEGGLVSSFLHNQINTGDTVEAYAPSGKFRIENNSDLPLVMISGGVGITPFLSALEEIGKNSFRETILINVVRNGAEHIRKKWLDELSLESPHIQVFNFYSAPDRSDIQGLDYQARGRVTLASIQKIVKTPVSKFYLCGSKSMTQSLYEQLTDWGVADEDILMEGFGDPDSTPKKELVEPSIAESNSTTISSITVKFEQSKKTLEWNPAAETILDLAEQNGIELESVCRSGDCGACRIGLLSGSVEYQDGHSAEGQTKHCLPCLAKPTGDVVLNA